MKSNGNSETIINNMQIHAEVRVCVFDFLCFFFSLLVNMCCVHWYHRLKDNGHFPVHCWIVELSHRTDLFIENSGCVRLLQGENVFRDFGITCQYETEKTESFAWEWEPITVCTLFREAPQRARISECITPCCAIKTGSSGLSSHVHQTLIWAAYVEQKEQATHYNWTKNGVHSFACSSTHLCDNNCGNS